MEQTVETKVGAKTLTLDTKTGHIFLITAEFGPPPPASPSSAQVGPPGRPRRGAMLPDSFSILFVGK